MNTDCKNCGQSASGNYCSNCGQATNTNRINVHVIIHEFLHGIIHVDKGIVYTIKELTIRPGTTIRGYFEGKRISLFKPFGYFFILATLYVFLTHMSGNNIVDFEVRSDATESTAEQIPQKVKMLSDIFSNLFEKHYSILILCAIPLTSLITMWFFKAEKLNYGEHIVMNSYIQGHQILLSIALIPFYFFFNESDIRLWSFWLQGFLFIYMIASTFNNYKLWKRILYPLLCQLVLFGIITLATLTFIIGFVSI